MSDEEQVWKTRAASFDAVAALYDAVRPAYPEALVDVLLRQGQVPPRGRVLEIGSGTGKMTALLAARGLEILCIERGENMAAVAREKFRNQPNVTIHRMAFEDWPDEPEAFDLVVSAQAFHWLDPEIRYTKTARVLKPGMPLALVWNIAAPSDREIFKRLDHVYASIAPQVGDGVRPQRLEDNLRHEEKRMLESGAFTGMEVMRFPWSQTYTTRQYLDLLSTHSDHLLLPAEVRGVLFSGITGVLNTYGGQIEKPYESVLLLARKV